MYCNCNRLFGERQLERGNKKRQKSDDDENLRHRQVEGWRAFVG
jgi:hypothetical protein